MGNFVSVLLDNMITIVVIVGILGGLAFIFGVLLVVASNIFSVKSDDDVQKLTELLPGGNCAGCGYASCSDYANAVINKGEKPNLCKVADQEAFDAIYELLNIEKIKAEKRVAVVVCSGYNDLVSFKYKYKGHADCNYAAKLSGGNKDCQYACLGLGSCAKACPSSAITVKNGVAVVNSAKCTGCGICQSVCPKNAIIFVKSDAKVYVGCNSKDNGKTLIKNCDAGCIKCSICVKSCEKNAITIDNGIPVINYDICNGCGICKEKCPRHIIRSLSQPNKKVKKSQSKKPVNHKINIQSTVNTAKDNPKSEKVQSAPQKAESKNIKSPFSFEEDK